jgi:hypothetical protein
MAKKRSKVLLVEGKQDRFVIPELIEANGIDWGSKDDPVVFIRDFDGYQGLVNPDVIATELQASGLISLGIMIDADDDPISRWQSIRNASLISIPDLPTTLPSDGLIHTTSMGIRFGVWIMPDNEMCGMLETFLTYIMPSGNEALWQLAQTNHWKCQTARS